jgi:hypothetical protein
MPEVLRILAAPAALVLMMAVQPSLAQESSAPESPAAQAAGPTPSLETLLQQFDARAPEPPGGVKIDGWVESTDAGREVVVMVAPEGKVKLVADPGITVTPTARPGVDWQLPLPYRMVDTERDYFDPPAMVRLPFTSTDEEPVELLVEYAYCLVDFQCFFGEEELTVATTAP